MKRTRDPRHTSEWATSFRFLRVPLGFIEYWMPILERSEIAVWLYILRHTVGYRREDVELKYSQIATGTMRKDGKHADYGTGLTIPGVRSAVQSLRKAGLIHVTTTGNGANRYRCDWRLPATVVAPENGSACYCGSTPGDTAVAAEQAAARGEQLAKCAGDQGLTAIRRKPKIVPIDKKDSTE